MANRLSELKITPMLATLVDRAFDDKGWVFEIKWDGYRSLAYKTKRHVELISRGQKSFNARFPTIAKAVENLPGKFILDGEIVVLDEKGRSNFQLLQNYQRRDDTPYYYVFDILSHNGKDVIRLPLIERKKILKKLLVNAPAQIRFSDHVEERGKLFFRKIRKLGLEGMIAKKSSSTYQFRRSKDWLKVKTTLRQEVVIGGFTEPKGSRAFFGALLVGVYEKSKLLYVGHVGGGFDEKLLGEIYQKLAKLKVTRCPFATEPHPNSPVTWIKPKLVCEVSFTEWTADGKMRQPIFKGMRSDKDPKDVIKEKPLKI